MTSADDGLTARHRGEPAHPDPETLALVSLGEGVSAEVSAHVADCLRCRADVDSLTTVADLARTLQPADLLTRQPPPELWDRIAEEVGLQPSQPTLTAPVMVARPALPKPTVAPGQERMEAIGPAPAQPPSARPTASPSRRRVSWLLAAAVAGVVVGASGLATWNALRSDSPSSLPKVVSSAKLRPLPAKTGRGTAQVTTTSGRRELSLDVQAPTPHNAFLEVWLMSDPDHLVSLGTLDSSTGSFALPAGINLEKYSIVDVSIEPYDGNPAHSSDSLVRGTLDPS